MNALKAGVLQLAVAGIGLTALHFTKKVKEKIFYDGCRLVAKTDYLDLWYNPDKAVWLLSQKFVGPRTGEALDIYENIRTARRSWESMGGRWPDSVEQIEWTVVKSMPSYKLWFGYCGSEKMEPHWAVMDEEHHSVTRFKEASLAKERWEEVGGVWEKEMNHGGYFNAITTKFPSDALCVNIRRAVQ